MTRTSAARDAGLSRDQKRDALRIAKIPEAEFEAAVESDRPPTATQLAERGQGARARRLASRSRSRHGTLVAGRSGAAVVVVDLPGVTVPEPPGRRWTWPQRLQAGVLAQALDDLTGSDAGLAADARAWFAAADDVRPFAFVAICSSLGLDAGAVRRAVAGRQPKPLSRRRAAWLAAVRSLPDVVLDGEQSPGVPRQPAWPSASTAASDSFRAFP